MQAIRAAGRDQDHGLARVSPSGRPEKRLTPRAQAVGDPALAQAAVGEEEAAHVAQLLEVQVQAELEGQAVRAEGARHLEQSDAVGRQR